MPGEPLSASQSALWAEHASKEWGSIFQQALEQRTEFSKTPAALPIPGLVPEFDCFRDGRAIRGTLRAFGVVEWEVRTSIAGLVTANARTSSECLLAISSPTRAYLDNNYPRYPERTSRFSMNSQSSVAGSGPSITSPAPDNTPDQPNYLAVLTLAWGYVLSAYWTETQHGEIRYTEHKTPCNLPSIQNSNVPRTRFTLHLNAPSFELRWWQAILAPGRGWEATINRDGQTWLTPWTVENEPDSRFSIVWEGESTLEPEQPPGYKQALDILVEFATHRGLQCQSSIALMAALNIPTHNLWALSVRLPRPHAMDRHRSASSEDTATLQRLKDQLPRLVTIALFGVESFLRSGFFHELVHSLSSGQWLQPAIVSWPNSSAFAAEVGCRRTPQLAKWWIGMAVSGMLAKKSVADLVGTGMWSANLGICVWTGAKDSYFCNVFGQDIGIQVTGAGKWATIPRAEEVLVLFATSGNGPQGRLMDPSVCPWRPPGDVLLVRSTAKVIEMAQCKATIRLYYSDWHWAEGSKDQTSHSSVFHSASFDQMAETSGAVTRSLLGWLGNTRGSDADFNAELEALKDQIRVVEEDEEIGGSDNLSDDGSTSHPASYLQTASSLGASAGREFDNAELVDEWNGDINEIGGRSPFGWCGLDAINSGLSQRGLAPISKDEAIRILSVTETDITQHGLSVNELEVLLNTRKKSVAIVDLLAKKVYRLRTSQHKSSMIAVGFRPATHFISLKQE
jgi:hypothetical protein